MVKLVECPRDAMQGWPKLIPTEKKIRYINALLQVGFNTIDFGSYVSPKAIPQMADTAEVLEGLELTADGSKLLAIVANERGASQALLSDKISYLGFPFSVSETFQQRNTNSTMSGSLERVEEIQNLCIKNGRELVVYISMGFGNPYGDPYSEEFVFDWVNRLAEREIRIISLSDTIGLATPEQVKRMTSYLVDVLPDLEIGVHLHSKPGNWQSKLESVLDSGCRRIDGALKGIGGCPMAGDELVGNMDTEMMAGYLLERNFNTGLDMKALLHCSMLANEVFV